VRLLSESILTGASDHSLLTVVVFENPARQTMAEKAVTLRPLGSIGKKSLVRSR